MRVLVERIKNMNNKLFVGNLPFTVKDSDLQPLFEQYGEVVSCSVAMDRETGRPRGFGFVEMQTQAAAEDAIRGLNGRDMSGRQMSVSISLPRPQKTRRY
jgi:RNA recognition motif-containing protein